MFTFNEIQDSVNKSIKFSNKNVYHYSSLEKIKNIIETSQLWVSDKTFLNDVYEDHYPEKLFHSILNKMDIDNDIKKIIDKYLCINQYVFSLSTEKDLANQWFVYGKHDGYCLVFNKREIDKYFVRNTRGAVHYGKVMYDKSEISKLIIKMCTFINENKYVFLHRDLTSIFTSEKVVPLLSSIFSMIKLENYKCEYEYRECVIFPGNTKVYTRIDKGIAIPYIKVPDYFDNTKLLLPIDEIIIGPSNNDLQAEKGLRKLLDLNGYFKTKIKRSALRTR